jgi:hypothetical protein
MIAIDKIHLRLESAESSFEVDKTQSPEAPRPLLETKGRGASSNRFLPSTYLRFPANYHKIVSIDGLYHYFSFLFPIEFRPRSKNCQRDMSFGENLSQIFGSPR